jgi:hypothetical protein
MKLVEVSKTSLKMLFDETQQSMLKEADTYGLPRSEIEPRHWAKAKLVLSAPNLVEAQLASNRAISSLHVHLLVLTHYAKRIPGQRTPENLEKKAKQAEGIAKMQEKFGKTEAAEQQRTKAKTLRSEAEKLRGNPESPPIVRRVRRPVVRRPIVRARKRSKT